MAQPPIGQVPRWLEGSSDPGSPASYSVHRLGVVAVWPARSEKLPTILFQQCVDGFDIRNARSQKLAKGKTLTLQPRVKSCQQLVLVGLSSLQHRPPLRQLQIMPEVSSCTVPCVTRYQLWSMAHRGRPIYNGGQRQPDEKEHLGGPTSAPDRTIPPETDPTCSGRAFSTMEGNPRERQERCQNPNSKKGVRAKSNAQECKARNAEEQIALEVDHWTFSRKTFAGIKSPAPGSNSSFLWCNLLKRIRFVGKMSIAPTLTARPPRRKRSKYPQQQANPI